MLKDVKGCGRILKDVEGCEGILNDNKISIICLLSHIFVNICTFSSNRVHYPTSLAG